MRQLYQATVTPITDYAASTWYGPGRLGVGKLVRHLERVQRLGAQAITGAFRIVALPTAEGEAYLIPVDLRLRAKVSKHLVRLYTLLADNLVVDCVKRFPKQGEVYPSPLRKTWDYYGSIIALERIAPIETIIP